MAEVKANVGEGSSPLAQPSYKGKSPQTTVFLNLPLRLRVAPDALVTDVPQVTTEAGTLRYP